MSGSYQNTGGLGAKDDSLYDPDRHDNQLVAVYQDRTEAEAARKALMDAGIPSSAIEIHDNSSGSSDRLQGSAATEDEGFWGSIKNLFAPDDDARTYHTALDRGHAMLVVTPTGQVDRSHVITILEAHNPVDVDSKSTEWQQTGYASTAAPAMASGLAEASPGFGTSQTAASMPAANTASLASTTGQNLTGAGQNLTGNDGMIEVVQERLRVGKREVAQGAVRVRSYVVERPVEEQVQLHEEHVQVERRPVDRAVTAGDTGLFQERTIEARGTAEEAVVSKEARVVEEIGIRKDATERTETVRDTLRETKVDIDDQTVTPTPGGTIPPRR